MNILNWSNTKTNNQDTHFVSSIQENITYFISIDIECSFVWYVNQIKQSETSNQFNFQIPDPTLNNIYTYNIKVEARDITMSLKFDQQKFKTITWSITLTSITNISIGSNIQNAIDLLPINGGIIILNQGTHNPPGTININGKNNIVVKGQTQTKEDTKIEFESRPTVLNIVDCSNIHISNMYINSTASGLPGDSDGFGIHITNSDNITVSNTKIENFRGGLKTPLRYVPSENDWNHYLIIEDGYFTRCKSGISLMETRYAQVKRNISSSHSSYAGIDFNAAVHDTLVEENICYNNSFDGIYMYMGNKRNIIKGNICYNNQNGITLYTATEILIENNTLTNNNWTGIQITSSGYGANNIDIINNTISKNKNMGINIVYTNPPVSGTYIVNIKSNTIYGNTSDGIFANTSYFNTTILNNIIQSNGGFGIRRTNGNIINSYNNIFNNTNGSYDGILQGNNEISIDSLFANIITDDYHLKSQSGRWTISGWVKDSFTSLCLKAGDPTSDNIKSLFNGIIELGRYGNTSESSNNQITCPIPICEIWIYY